MGHGLITHGVSGVSGAIVKLLVLLAIILGSHECVTNLTLLLLSRFLSRVRSALDKAL